MDEGLKEVLNGGFGPGCLASTPPTVNLMRLYKEIVRSEVCKHTIESIYKLCDHHLSTHNYAEAGFTLKMHADRLNWTWDPVPGDAFGSLGQLENRNHQFEWQLKENLYITMLDYFDRAKCWEEGIPLMKEMAEFYERKIFDYFKWSQLLKNQSLFLDNILNQFRPESEYFRVGFYGCGFPAFLRNKVFIYRGLEFEKIAAFTERLQTEFPHASLITKSGPPDDSIHDKDGQFMQVVSVKPVQEARPEFEGKEVPDKVLTYYLTNNVKTFISDRPLHKGQVDRENEFKSLWIERSTLVTGEKLPGILRWSEVVSKKMTELSPIEHACETVENMNRELQKLIVSYSLEPTKQISPLSMRLQGVIEAAVNGGVAKYQDAFFNPKYIHLHPEEGPYIRRLKQLILQKVRILEGGLSLHGRLAPTNIQPLQRRLLERLTVMRQNVMEASANVVDSALDSFPHRRNPSIIHTPLPPIPVLEPLHGASEHHHSLPGFISDRRNSETYQAPLVKEQMKEQNGNVNNTNNNNYHDVIYAVPAERSTNNDPGAGCPINGLVLVGSNNIVDPTSPPPLPPKRPKRPRSTGMNCSMNSSSMDMASPSTPTTPPPPRPPIPLAATSPNISGSINCSNNDSSLLLERSIQRSRSIPRSTNSFQLSNMIQQINHHDPVNGNLYTPSPTRTVTNSNNDLMSPQVPPRTVTLPSHLEPVTLPSHLERNSERNLERNSERNLERNSERNLSSVQRATPAKEALHFPTQIKTPAPPLPPPKEEDDERPVLPPKTVRKTISSNQLDTPAVDSSMVNGQNSPMVNGQNSPMVNGQNSPMVSCQNSPMVNGQNSSMSNGQNRTSSVNVTSISVNGGSSGHKTSTLPNRRPPPPTPPLDKGTSSPPPPHHPPPPAPPLSSSEECELLSMSIATSLSMLENDETFTLVSPPPSSAGVSSAGVSSAVVSSASSSSLLNQERVKSSLQPVQQASAVSVITVNSSSPLTCITTTSTPSLNSIETGTPSFNSIETGTPSLNSIEKGSEHPPPSTIIRVTNTSSVNEARKSSQSTGSNSSSSSEPCASDDIKGV